ncbi:MAG: glycosyltransferase [Burkholderiaceae bacterium]|nr:glycosyltransferase [Burkholderiaceae bacterium]MCF8184964.1 glycosyltransferase [Polynucleobacter sp.]
MKFALFTTNLAGGGAEKALAKIAGGLAARGHEVDFIVCEDAGQHAAPADCRFHALSARAGHGWLGRRLLASRLSRLLKSNPPDLLVSTLPFADEVAALVRVRRHVCRIANTLSAEIARLPLTKAKRRAARYHELYGARRLVAVSQGVAADLQTQFGIAADALRVIANPFDFAAIRALSAEACAARPTEPYILHIGRFAAQKRHDLLLAAFARAELPHHLVLLTPPEPKLAALIAQHGLERRVTIADFQANPYPWMAGAELLVLCSDHEGLPNVLIEALACGTRVVSTDCPSGPREILRGELAQWLLPCNDVEALARTLRAALDAPKPSTDVVAGALAPYGADGALDAWEALAREAF